MKELEYAVLELEKESKKTCDFCSKFENKNNKSVHQIRSRSKVTGEWISDDMVSLVKKGQFSIRSVKDCVPDF